MSSIRIGRNQGLLPHRQPQQIPRDSLPRARDRICGSNARDRVSDDEASHGHATQRAHSSSSNLHYRASRSKAGDGKKASATAKMESPPGAYVCSIPAVVADDTGSTVRTLHQSLPMPQSKSSQRQCSSKASDRRDHGFKHEEQEFSPSPKERPQTRMKRESGATEQVELTKNANTSKRQCVSKASDSRDSVTKDEEQESSASPKEPTKPIKRESDATEQVQPAENAMLQTVTAISKRAPIEETQTNTKSGREPRDCRKRRITNSSYTLAVDDTSKEPSKKNRNPSHASSSMNTVEHASNQASTSSGSSSSFGGDGATVKMQQHASSTKDTQTVKTSSSATVKMSEDEQKRLHRCGTAAEYDWLGDSREDHQRIGLRQRSRSVRRVNTHENDWTPRAHLRPKQQQSSRQVRIRSRSESRRREFPIDSFGPARRRVQTTVILTPRVSRTTSLKHHRATSYRAPRSDSRSFGKRHLSMGRSLRVTFRKYKRKKLQLISRDVKKERADVTPGKLFQSLIEFFVAIVNDSCFTN